MKEFTFKRSCSQAVRLLIMSLAFVAAGVFLLLSTPHNWVAWASIIFFGIGSAFFIWQIFDSSPSLIINDRGIFDRTLGIGFISWSDIVGAYPMNIASANFICLKLHQREIYAHLLPQRWRSAARLNQELGFTEFTLNVTGIDIDPVELCELICQRIQANQ